jgi:hypothetical protein
VIACNPDLAVGEECYKTDLDMAVGEGARSLDHVVATSLPKAVAVTCKVHRLQKILPIASWVPGYSENAAPGFKAKPNAHSMCAQESSLHTYHTQNGYRITNASI